MSWPPQIRGALENHELKAGDLIILPDAVHSLGWSIALRTMTCAIQVKRASAATRDTDGWVEIEVYLPTPDRTGVRCSAVISGTQKEICGKILYGELA